MNIHSVTDMTTSTTTRAARSAASSTSSATAHHPRSAVAKTEDSPKRDAILAAALELFAERGFHGTAVPLVADRAGVGAGTVYRYFDSKESLVNALFVRWKTELGNALLASFAPGAEPREMFSAFWRALGDFATRHPLALGFLELHYHGAYLDAHSLEVERNLLEPLKALIETWKRKKIIKAMPAEMIMALVYGAFVGLVRARASSYLTLSPSVMEASEECVWDAIRR